MAASKEKFIEEIDKLLEDVPDFFALNEEAYEYYLLLKNDKESCNKKDFTENGVKVLRYMQENYKSYNNVFTAQNIGEGLFIPPRSVSGTMRKLISDGYAIKVGNKPTSYAITPKGENHSFDF